MTHTPILTIEALTLTPSIGLQPILQGISLAIASGEFIALVGPTGSGKTSLFRLLNGLQAPTHGTIHWQQRPLTNWPITQLRRQMVWLPEQPKLLGMTVAETLAYPLKLQGLDPSQISQAVETWTEKLAIPDRWFQQTEFQLTLAQRQRVAIARALTLNPCCLLLDQPTIHFDTAESQKMLILLKQLSQSQGMVVIVANNRIEPTTDHFYTRLLRLQGGCLVADQPGEQVNWLALDQELQQQQLAEQSEWGDEVEMEAI
jgi:D-methionine transport system ATP-binding protein